MARGPNSVVRRRSTTDVLLTEEGKGARAERDEPSASRAQKEANDMRAPDYLGVGMCAGGILSTLVCYGILQERIMTRPYGDGKEKEYFRYSLFIVFLNRALTCLAALVTNVVKRESLRPVAPLYAYAGVSFSNVIATSCQYEALKYVTFPVQTLAKTAKMVPVMLWGTLILLKTYTISEYALALLVTGGCTLFLLSGDVGSKVAKKAAASGGAGGAGGAIYGGGLMLGYLGFDGFTSTFQEKLFKGYKMSPHHQVLFVTLFSSCFALFSLLLGGMLGPALGFVSRHPSCIGDILLLSTTAVASQFIIAFTIKSYGALVFAAIMTTRQFVSILVSNVIFGHPMSGGQWVGLAVVFGTLYAKIQLKGKARRTADPETKAQSLPLTSFEKPQSPPRPTESPANQ